MRNAVLARPWLAESLAAPLSAARLQAPRYYGPGYYGSGYGYYGPAAAYGGDYDDCYWQRQRFWDGYGWRIRRVRVCG